MGSESMPPVHYATVPRRGMRVVTVAIGAIILLVAAVALVGNVATQRDKHRQDALAAAALADIAPGMTVAEAQGALDRHGLRHFGPYLTVDHDGLDALPAECGVVYSHIRNAIPWAIVTRDVQIRVYIDGANNVTRATQRDIMTGQ